MSFRKKHIGISKKNVSKMLNIMGVTKNELLSKIIPNKIRYEPKHFRDISETQVLTKLNYKMNHKFTDYKYLLGMDYHDTILPNVIKRNLLENPKWYTSYTPYQAEISQGRLESLFNYQTLISELTGLPVTNCSLLDSGSASVEALNMTYSYHKGKKDTFFLDTNNHPQVKEIIKTRAKIMDLNLIEDDLQNIKMNDNMFGALFSYPNTYGNIDLFTDIISDLNKNDISVISHNDIMSLMLLKSPGELNIDVSFGTTQRFGLPFWFGGPHSAFFATNEKYTRLLPGRIVGESIDRNNNKCYRLALQTREQHIKRDKASSNICTSQALLANVSSMYAINHGKERLIDIAKTIHLKTKTIKHFIGIYFETSSNDNYFDSFKILTKEGKQVFNNLKSQGFYTRLLDDGIMISVNENLSFLDCVNLINSNMLHIQTVKYDEINLDDFKKKYKEYESELESDLNFTKDLIRNDDFLNQEIFKHEKSETEMLRYINNLSDKDYSLVNGMIPLGSCTMKLNSTTQMEPMSWNIIQNVHPFVHKIPDGYNLMINSLTKYLLNITNMDAISYQSNAGSVGEYTGLLCIKKYHKTNGEKNRNICLIPASAHGTNFTSAKLAGLKILKYDDKLSIEEFKKLVEKINEDLSCLMITYPNTYGVFDENIKDITDIIHNNGGLVYMDGANMNAQSGYTSPGTCGADVCHLNLHKTFCIPHGGGGPGMGPICVNKKLEPFLPSNIITNKNYNHSNSIGMITSSNFSSASLLTIPYIYFNNMGSEGVKEATFSAILCANYLKHKLSPYYKIYNTNKNGFVGHEFIIDLNEFKEYGVNEKDIAKRLIDYSFHPPTMSWPIPCSIMIEPTESESLEELDRFVEAMITIHKEIEEIKNNVYDSKDNVLVNAPHSFSDLTNWKFPYNIEKAFYPVESLKINKVYPSVSRVNDIYGDRNLKFKLDN